MIDMIGKVVGVSVLPDRVWLSVRKTTATEPDPYSDEEQEDPNFTFYTERNSETERIQAGDRIWWIDDRRAYWTSKDDMREREIEVKDKVKDPRKLTMSKTTVDQIVELNGKGRNWDQPQEGEPIFVSLADIDIKRPPEIQETIDLIIKLPRELQEELAALMWIGRETEFEYFENALIHAKKAYTNPAEETLYIAAKPLFEYLPRAIEKLSEAGIALSE